jgi:hypothetical protein
MRGGGGGSSLAPRGRRHPLASNQHVLLDLSPSRRRRPCRSWGNLGLECCRAKRRRHHSGGVHVRARMGRARAWCGMEFAKVNCSISHACRVVAYCQCRWQRWRWRWHSSGGVHVRARMGRARAWCGMESAKANRSVINFIWVIAHWPGIVEGKTEDL